MLELISTLILFTELSSLLIYLVVLEKYASRMNCVLRKPTMRFPNRSETNQAGQAQKMAGGWKFWI